MNSRVMERPQAGIRVPVDPRIRRRRVEVTRAEGRRRFKILLAVLGSVALVATGWAATRSALLDVDAIAVLGAEHSTVAEVVAASGIRTGQALTDVETTKAEAGIGRLAWVLSVSVTKDWPGSVRVTLTERRPVAAVERPAATGSGWAVVDATGRVLETVGERPGPLPPIVGLEVVPGPGGQLREDSAAVLAVAGAVPDSLLQRLTGVSPGNPTGPGIELLLEGGARIRIGSPDRLMEKFRSVVTVMTRVNTAGLDVLDVSVPDSPVLTRRAQS